MLVGKALSFANDFFLFSIFVNQPRSLAAQLMAIKCIPEVRS